MHSNHHHQLIQHELQRLFLHSSLSIFFQFLQTPKAKQIISFINPHTFGFSANALRDSCPEIEKFGNQFITYLRKEGLKVKYGVKNGQHEISHETLTADSSDEEIMEGWLKAMQGLFLRRRTGLGKLYWELQNGNLKWDWKGEKIQITGEQAKTAYSSIRSGCGFKFKGSGGMVWISHPLLRKQSPIENWIVVYLRCREKDNFKHLKIKNKNLLHPKNEKVFDVTRRNIIALAQLILIQVNECPQISELEPTRKICHQILSYMEF